MAVLNNYIHPRTAAGDWWRERLHNLYKNLLEVDTEQAKAIQPHLTRVITSLNDGVATQQELSTFAGQVRKALEGEYVGR